MCNNKHLCAGGDLCEVSSALCRFVSASGGAELSCYRNSQRHGSGGEVRKNIIINLSRTLAMYVFLLFTLCPVLVF